MLFHLLFNDTFLFLQNMDCHATVCLAMTEGQYVFAYGCG
jgi:hypothetical protein